MSAHGPYLLQDGPNKTFWREGRTPEGNKGAWVLRKTDATTYPTKIEAERARTSLKIGVGRANLGRVHIVAEAEAREAKPRTADHSADIWPATSPI